MGACQHPHRHCSSIVRDRPCAGRNSGRDASAGHAGAPVAIAIRASARSRSQIISFGIGWRLSAAAGGCRRLKPRPETSKGRLGFPGGPSAQMMFYITCLENLRGNPPPCPDRAETPYRRAVRRSGRSGSGTATPRRSRHWRLVGYVLGRVTRVPRVWELRCSPLANSAANRTMMRRIAVSNRSVKRFFDEIHNDAWRLAFRRSG